MAVIRQELLIQHCAVSSVKCLPKLVRARSVIQKVLWVFSLLLGSSFCVYQISQLLKYYLSFPVVTNVYYTNEQNLTIPEVTVCNMNPMWSTLGDKGMFAEVSGFPGRLTFDKYINTVLLPDLKTDYREQIASQYLFSLSGFMKHVTLSAELQSVLKSWMFVTCQWRSTTNSTKCPDESIVPILTPEHGLCFNIRPPADITPRHALVVILFLNNLGTTRYLGWFDLSVQATFGDGALVALHYPATIPDMKKAVVVKSGQMAAITARETLKVQLEPPYGPCNESVSLQGFDVDWAYTNDVCNQLCLQTIVLKNCHCLSNLLQTSWKLRDKHSFCAIYNSQNITKTLGEIQCMEDVLSRYQLNIPSCCHCDQPCDNYNYEFTLQQTPWPHQSTIPAFFYKVLTEYGEIPELAGHFTKVRDVGRFLNRHNITDPATHETATEMLGDQVQEVRDNFLQFSVQMKDDLTKEETKRATNLADLFGSVSGILNLWVGVTFITIMEIIDFCIACCIKTEPKKQREQQTSVEMAAQNAKSIS